MIVEPLPERTVHVWFARPCAGTDLQDCWTLLSRDEQSRAERFRHEPVQRLFVCAHALVRRVLSRYAPVDPADWRFALEGQGKPKIAAPAEFAWLQFNLSHTLDLAVCGVSRESPIGVDVEHLERRQRRRKRPENDDCLPLARHCLAEPEIAQLAPLDVRERWLRFLQFWTLKESYLKACATGISQPLDRFAFSWEAGRPRIEFLSGQDDAAWWTFAEHRPSELHVAAVALRGTPVENVLWREFSSLGTSAGTR